MLSSDNTIIHNTHRRCQASHTVTVHAFGMGSCYRHSTPAQKCRIVQTLMIRVEELLVHHHHHHMRLHASLPCPCESTMPVHMQARSWMR